MWYEPPKYIKPVKDINAELALLKGELEDKQARITLAKFLRRNIGTTLELMSGVRLSPYQIITIKGMLERNYSMCVWGRGCGKTFTAAMFCILQAIFEPNTKILVAGPTFRTSRFIFKHIEDICSKPEAQMLAACFGHKARRNDEFHWEINGGSIVAIPLNGEKIRGFRANVLVIDEFFLMSEEMVEKVLMPYLVAPQNVGERIKIIAREDELIRVGKMKEEERMTFENNSKMVALSSASYTCEYLYRKYEDFASKIYSKDVSKEGVKFFISQLSWDSIPKEMIDKSVIEVAQSNESNLAVFKREYGAQFVDGSDGYYSMNKMIACTIPDGQEPTIQLRGDKDKKYILSLDPNASSSGTADDFAMSVIEIETAPDGTSSGSLVHCYARSGVDLKEHIAYYFYLLINFNIEMIICDNAGYLFLDAANESELLRNAKLEIKIFEFSAEKDGPDLEEELRKARIAYNKTGQKIAFTQVFSTDFIRKGNEWLQSRIDYKKIWFSGSIKANGSVFNRILNGGFSQADLALVGHETIDDFITEQEVLIKQTKYQCAAIEVKTSPRGVQTFDLPQIMKRDLSEKRPRKDSYTALVLGVWGLKCYSDIMSTPVQHFETFTPFFAD